VHLNSVWNWTMRGTGPEPEPGDTHVRAANRRFFLPALVLEWLSAKEGNPVPAWAWSRRWLVEHRLLGPEADPAQVLTAVRHLAQGRLMRPKWKVRRTKHLARLEAVHAADPAAGEMIPSRSPERGPDRRCWRLANPVCGFFRVVRVSRAVCGVRRLLS
jgi:hypothetical protein